MSLSLTACPSCSRHVKGGDSKCPFCGNKVLRANASVARVVAGRLSRAALFAAGAAGLAITTTDCGSDPQPLPPYGSPPCCEVFPPDAAPEDASVDAADGGVSTPEAAAYGDASGDVPIGDASGDALDGNSMSPADAPSADGTEEAAVVCGACPAYGGPPNPPCCP